GPCGEEEGDQRQDTSEDAAEAEREEHECGAEGEVGDVRAPRLEVLQEPDADDRETGWRGPHVTGRARGFASVVYRVRQLVERSRTGGVEDVERRAVVVLRNREGADGIGRHLVGEADLVSGRRYVAGAVHLEQVAERRHDARCPGQLTG